MKIGVRLVALALLLSLTACGGSSKGSTSPPALQTARMKEIVITVTASGFDAPSTVLAGRYLITLVNQTGVRIEAALTRLPKGTSIDNVVADFTDRTNGAPPPKWVAKATLAGGPVAGPRATGQAVVTLDKDNWIIWNRGQAAPRPVKLEVTKEDARWADAPDAQVNVGLKDDAVTGLDEPLAAGLHVWRVKNDGKQPHVLSIRAVPAGTTSDEVVELLASGSSVAGASPVAGQLVDTDLVEVGAVSALSPKQSAWIVLDLPAGRYVALSLMPDATDGRPAAAHGAVKMFTVV